MNAMTPDMLALTGSLLGCDAPIWRPMTIWETGPDGTEIQRETSMASACDTCPACLNASTYRTIV